MLLVPLLNYLSLPTPSEKNLNYFKIAESGLYLMAVSRICQIFSKIYAKVIFQSAKTLIFTALVIKITDWYSFELMAKAKRKVFPFKYQYHLLPILAAVTPLFKRYRSENAAVNFAGVIGVYCAVLIDYALFAPGGTRT